MSLNGISSQICPGMAIPCKNQCYGNQIYSSRVVWAVAIYKTILFWCSIHVPFLSVAHHVLLLFVIGRFETFQVKFVNWRCN